MPTARVLLGMTLGAVVATLGALFLGEYEFDELLPILSGALLGLIVAEVVVSVGKLRALPLAVLVAAWSATAVVLAGVLDSNETEPIKTGAYLSAALSALAALARANDWKRKSKGSGKDARDRAEAQDDVVDAQPAPQVEAPGPRQRRQRQADDAPPAIPTGPVRARTQSSRRLEPRVEPRRDAGVDPRRPRPKPEDVRVRATPRRSPRTDQGR